MGIDDASQIGAFLGLRESADLNERFLRGALQAIRKHLNMEVAFLSEFRDGRRLFRFVDSALPGCPVSEGGGDPLDDTYCQRIVDGRLPALLPDAAANAEARKLAVTSALPVGAHVSVPVHLADGMLYGTFCCFSRRPDPSLTERDVAVLRAFADLAAQFLEASVAEPKRLAAVARRLRRVLSGNSLASVYQPIVNLATGAAAGFEALARFDAEPRQGPDKWFADASSVGMAVELETAAAARALGNLSLLRPDQYVGVNISPQTLLSRDFARLLDDVPARRVVLEITEHHVVQEYEKLATALRPFRSRRVRIAVDDAGAGYASFRHILQLHPDYIKLDLSLTRGIHADPGRRALAAALIQFARETDAVLVAEGVESVEELRTLRELGVVKAQGYLLGKPMAIEDARAYVPPRPS